MKTIVGRLRSLKTGDTIIFLKKMMNYCKLRSQEEINYWSVKLGDNYKTFWNGMAQTKEGAYIGVVGRPFGKVATDESVTQHGNLVAPIIISKLGIKGSDKVLEIGVGVGRLAEFIAPHCKEFYGVDISENMIRLAKGRLHNHSNIKLTALGNVDLSIFANETFDKIYSHCVLIHLDREDVYHYLRESHRVLKQGGRAYFQFYNLLHDNGWLKFQRMYEDVLRQGAKERGRVHCLTAPEVRRYLMQAGFVIDEKKSNLEMVDQQFDFEVPPVEDWNSYLMAVCVKH